MSAHTASPPRTWEVRALSLERGRLLSAAIAGILLGIFVLVRPDTGLATVAVVFGIYLVFAGVSRFAFAITGVERSTGRRWLAGILGVLVVGAGFFFLLNLRASLDVLGFVLGFGLIVAGIADLVTSDGDRESRPTWMRVTTGILTVVAGVVLLVVPLFSIGLVVAIGAVLLIAIGAATIFALPRLAPEEAELL